jgi:hypothetical protein
MAALKSFQQDAVSNLVSITQRALQFQADATLWGETAANAQFDQVTDPDLVAIEAFEHMTLAELVAARTAIANIVTAIQTNRAALVKVLR